MRYTLDPLQYRPRQFGIRQFGIRQHENTRPKSARGAIVVAYAIASLAGVLCDDRSCAASDHNGDAAQGANAADDRFRKADDLQIDGAFDAVAGAMRSLEFQLAASPANAVGWKAYLEWDRQQDRIARRDRGDVEVWRTIASRLSRDAPGLERQVFCDYRSCVETLLQRLRAAAIEEPDAAYDLVAQQLQSVDLSPGGVPAERDVTRLRAALQWLADHGQVHSAATSILQSRDLPNVMVRLRPESALGQNGPYCDRRPISGRLAGSPYWGTSYTDLTSTLRAVPASGQATMRFTFQGQYSTTTKSRSQGVAVGSASHYVIDASSVARLSLQGLQIEPLALAGDFHSHVTSITTPHTRLRGRVERDEALQGYRASYGQARRDTEQGLCSALETSLREQAALFNREFTTRVVQPLKRLDLGPRSADFSSDHESILVQGTLARRSELGAPSVPDMTLAPSDDLVAMIHESAVQNYLQRRQPIRTLSLGALLNSLGVQVNRSADELEALSIVPSTSAALECFFRDPGVVLVLHAQQITYRGQPFAAADVRVAFQWESAPGHGWRLHRRGPPEISRSVLEATPRRLGVRDIALRRVLTNVFDREIPQDVEIEAIGEQLGALRPASRLSYKR